MPVGRVSGFLEPRPQVAAPEEGKATSLVFVEWHRTELVFLPTMGSPFITAHSRDWGMGGGKEVGARRLHSPPAAPHCFPNDGTS